MNITRTQMRRLRLAGGGVATRLLGAQYDLGGKFMVFWRGLGGPPMIPEYRFHPTRLWRFDWALPQIRVAVELEGAVWTQGKHTRGAGYIKDCEKYNAVAMAGWRVFRFTTSTINVATLEPVIKWVLKIQQEEKHEKATANH